MKQLTEILEGFFANTGTRNPFLQLEEFFLSNERKGERTPIRQKHKEADEIKPIIKDILRTFARRSFRFTSSYYEYSFIIPEGPEYSTYFAVTRKRDFEPITWLSEMVTGKDFDDFCDHITSAILGSYWRSGDKLKNFEVSNYKVS